MTALFLDLFHNETTVRLNRTKHLHEDEEAAPLEEQQRLLTAINTMSMWSNELWWLPEQKYYNGSITDNTLWGVRCQWLQLKRSENQRSEKHYEWGLFCVFLGHLASIFFFFFFWWSRVSWTWTCMRITLKQTAGPSPRDSDSTVVGAGLGNACF